MLKFASFTSNFGVRNNIHHEYSLQESAQIFVSFMIRINKDAKQTENDLPIYAQSNSYLAQITP